ncbi:MAG: PadR family transcriptional regulator [Sphingomonadaceae bacterium]
MSLPHALITALLERPSSGQELARRFDKSIGYFWHATHQQIYRELGRLEQAGWIESLEPAATRGRQRAYCVLPAGREELRRWMADSSDPRPMRDELMLRIRAEAVVGPTGLADELARRLALHRLQLAHYQQIEAHDFPPGVHTREQQLQHLVLSAGIMMEQMWVQWSEQALAVLAQPAGVGAAD